MGGEKVEKVTQWMLYTQTARPNGGWWLPPPLAANPPFTTLLFFLLFPHLRLSSTSPRFFLSSGFCSVAAEVRLRWLRDLRTWSLSLRLSSFPSFC